MEISSVISAAVWTFALYTVVVIVLAWFSHRVLSKKRFLSEYFLGSRGLGVVAFTLTFGATSASAGSFAGFPSLIYTHGWVLALWIAGYMMVPLCTMGLLGKRMNQVARQCGCITIPDVLRQRFQSPALALTSTLLMVLMLSFYLIPQFKLAGIVLQQLMSDSPHFVRLAALLTRLPLMGSVDPEYVLSLLIFAVLVVIYTTYGGFRAVVWTDVLQGLVMGAGVIALLALALWYVGGLDSATRKMSEMVPPRLGEVEFEVGDSVDQDVRIALDTWFVVESPDGRRLLRTNETAVITKGQQTSNAVKAVEVATPGEVADILSRWSQGTPPLLPAGVQPRLSEFRDYAYGAGKRGVYVTAPGPVPGRPGDPADVAAAATGFLPIGVALSFFVYWTISGAGQPGSLVRLMAFNSSRTLRRGIAALTLYFGMIYFPLVIIFCCARVIVPGLDQTPDRIMPAVAFELSHWAGVPWLAGLLVAVPFSAAMSTVDSFMLMISSSVVRDLYQQQFNPEASERTIKRLSYGCTLIVGLVVTLGAMYPPKFLQYLIVFAGGGLAVSFLAPITLALYWRRANTAGMLSAMLAGLGVYLSLYVGGFFRYGEATPLQPWNLDPFIWGFLVSLTSGLLVSLLTKPPTEELVRRFFHE